MDKFNQMQNLLKEREILKSKIDKLYKETYVKVKHGDVVQSLYPQHCYYVFLSPWTGKLSYCSLGSCAHNEVHDGIINGVLLMNNGYDYVLNKYIHEAVSPIVIDSFKKMNSKYEKPCSCFQRYCHWCGQRIITDLAD